MGLIPLSHAPRGPRARTHQTQPPIPEEVRS